MSIDILFLELVKKKGIGESMGKSLSSDDFPIVLSGFQSDSISLERKATLLTALLMLPPTDLERAFLDSLKQNAKQLLPLELLPLLFPLDSPSPFLSVIYSLFSKVDLTETQLNLGMTALFDPLEPRHFKSAFLEGLRLKRETLLENQLALDAFYSRSNRIQTELPILIDIATAYDGFNRTPILLPFVAIELGRRGIPCLLHGLHSIGPKYGVTSAQVFGAMGVKFPSTLEEAVSFLNRSDLGFAYLDQSQFFPELFSLVSLRNEMVKRPFIATWEKFLQPIRAKNGNSIITGYTHPGYKDMIGSVLTSQKACRDFLCFRGVEGSAQLPVDRRSPFVSSVSTPFVNALDGFLSPDSFGFEKLDSVDATHFTVLDHIRFAEEHPEWISYFATVIETFFVS